MATVEHRSWQRTWRRAHLARAATASSGFSWLASAQADLSSDEPDVRVQQHRIWVDSPLRWRHEMRTPGTSIAAVTVVNEAGRWSHHPAIGLRRSDAQARSTAHSREWPFASLFDPEPFAGAGRRLPGHRQGSALEVVVLDRRVAGDLDDHLLPGVADLHEVAIDRDAGVVRTIKSTFDNDPLSEFVLVDFEFGVTLDPALFGEPTAT
jgi:hypothetical protein